MLETKRGIPITLSLIFLEVGRRSGFSLKPVSFPGHFLVRADTNGGPCFIDAFHKGTIQDEETLKGRLRDLTGKADLPRTVLDAAFAPCQNREVVARMLRNLKQIYIQQRDWPRALRITDQLLHVQPAIGEHYRDRGQLYAQVGHVAAAEADLSRYLQMVTDAREKERVRNLLVSLASQGRTLN